MSIIASYLILIAVLRWIQETGLVTFPSEITGIQDVFVTLPAVAFYIVVALAALAGWARGPAMFRELGLGEVLQKELTKRKISSPTIQSQIKGSTHTIKTDTPLKDALHDSWVARIPILPIVENGKVDNVITMYDISKKIDEELQKTSSKLLDNIKANDLKSPGSIVSCKPDDNLADVLNKMIQQRKTKIVVLKEDKSLVGTLDMFDIVAEMMREETKESD